MKWFGLYCCLVTFRTASRLTILWFNFTSASTLDTDVECVAPSSTSEVLTNISVESAASSVIGWGWGWAQSMQQPTVVDVYRYWPHSGGRRGEEQRGSIGGMWSAFWPLPVPDPMLALSSEPLSGHRSPLWKELLPSCLPSSTCVSSDWLKWISNYREATQIEARAATDSRAHYAHFKVHFSLKSLHKYLRTSLL